MRFSWKGALSVAVVGAALLFATTPASAQFGYYRPGGYGYGSGYPMGGPPGGPTAPMFSGGGASNPYGSLVSSPGSTAALTTSPSNPTVQVGDPFLNPYTSNPYATMYSPAGGFLSGMADLVTARSNAGVTWQRAMLVQEEVFRSRMDTRRKLWEEARYERAMLMDSEQLRRRNIQDALERARHQPPQEEVRSGLSLNNLFHFLSAQQGKGVQGPAIPVSDAVLKQINLTTGQGSNAGLLRSELVWPVPLQRPEFAETRKALTDEIQLAVDQAKVGGPVEQNKVANIKNNVEKMQEILRGQINDMQPRDYMVAKRYLGMLEDASRALSDPNVSNFLGTNKWTAQGKTVSELVRNMTEQGLQFAPATPGGEWAYQALYNAMRDYDANVVQLVGSPQK
jgi:hypothetical protein